MSAFADLLSQYDYELPPASIALEPAHPRESAKLYVYDRATQKITYSTFASLADFLPKNSVLVFNDTKVIPARLFVTMSDGDRVELFITSFSGSPVARALSNRKCSVGDVLTVVHGVTAMVRSKDGKECTVELHGGTWRDVLMTYGTTPIPPYLKNTTLSEDVLRTEYQTVFAKYEGSVAAPTASLHFSEALLQDLERAGFESTFVTLHVNLGTFAPLTEAHVESGLLHEEYFTVPHETQEKIARAKHEGRPIVPVGTTAMRTLESAFDEHGNCVTQHGSTRLFIQPGYVSKVASGLITNFHVPKSSLMMLVAALTGREQLLRMYGDAQQHGFRFYSFGDGMLII